MAWENFKVEQQRLQLLTAYMAGESSMTDLCAKYGISRKTGYKWYNRFLEDGENGLIDLSKAPHNPNFLYTEELIERAIDYKLKHRKWGPKKILVNLQNEYPNEDWPSPTRMYEIFKEYNLVTKRRIRSRVPATSPLGDLINCNDTWAVDFKGWFMTGDGRKCEPLTITDSVSRYLIRCTHLNPHTIDYVWPVFDEAFREYGLPNRMRSDNGSPFGSVGVGRLTRLSVKLIKAGVTPEWIRPGHPEENGRHERFHLTLKQEVASPPRETLPLQIQAMREFHHEYNFIRPHEALDMKTPGSCYHNSQRRWDGIFRSPEYDTKEMLVRKIQACGCISIRNKNVFIGEALIGEYVGLKPISNDEFEIYYSHIFLGKLTKYGMEKPEINTKRKKSTQKLKETE
jgi:transposase InsO family protein